MLEVREWVGQLRDEFDNPNSQVPVLELLKTLDALKDYEGASPTVYAARIKSSTLSRFSVEELTAAVEAVQTVVGRGWVGVQSAVEIFLDQSPDQIVAEVQRVLREDLEIIDGS